MNQQLNRPFAQSAEENKQVILQAMRPYLKGRVLEIGSGTGQHAVYFASQIPRLHWQPSDLEASKAGMALEADIEMPADNRSLVWKKRTL